MWSEMVHFPDGGNNWGWPRQEPKAPFRSPTRYFSSCIIREQPGWEPMSTWDAGIAGGKLCLLCHNISPRRSLLTQDLDDLILCPGMT